jgi:hypothetical protein
MGRKIKVANTQPYLGFDNLEIFYVEPGKIKLKYN